MQTIRYIAAVTAERVAIDMHARFADDTADIAAANAESCRALADMNGFQYWNLVCAMITHQAVQEGHAFSWVNTQICSG
jgi:hypothetical protein